MSGVVKTSKEDRKTWLARQALEVVRHIRARVEVWQATRRLYAADDYLLKDIGISRGDIDRLVRRGRPRKHFPK